MNLLTNLSPVQFVVEILIVIALLVIAIANLGLISFKSKMEKRRSSNKVAKWIRGQIEFGEKLGMTNRTWLVYRTIILVVLVGATSLTKILVLVFLGVAIGLFGVNWFFAVSIVKKKLIIDREFLNQVTLLRDKVVGQGLSLDTAIISMAVNAPKSLRGILQPILGDESISERLLKVAELAKTPLVSQVCVSLMIAREYDPTALGMILDDNLIPSAASRIEIEESNYQTLSQQRFYIYVLCALVLIMLGDILRVPTLQQAYTTVGGQIVLCFDAVAVLFIIWVVGKLLGAVQIPELNVRKIFNDFGGGRGNV